MSGEGLATGSHFERPGSMDPPPGPRCDKCGAGEGRGYGPRAPKLIRFGLEFRPAGKLGRGRVTRHIRLCEPCWKGLSS